MSSADRSPRPAGRVVGRGRLVRLGVYGGIVLVVLLGLPVFVFPAQHEPRRASLALVPADASPWQIEWAQDLLAAGRVDDVLIAVADGSEPPSTCEDGSRVRCATVPSRSVAASLHLIDHSAAASVLVLTTTPQVERTRITITRCLASAPGEVDVVGRAEDIDLRSWIFQYVRQTAGIVRTVVAPNC